MFYTRFVEGGRGLLCIGCEIVHAREIKETKAALDHDRFSAIAYSIIDLQEATDFHVTPGDLREIARIDLELSERAPNAFVAVVAPKDPHFGLARMWEVYVQATGWTTEVFRSPQEARKWIVANCDGETRSN